MAVSTGRALAYNARQIGYSDMNDRGDALQICGQRIGNRYFVYCGHLWSGGVTTLDVTDPASPEVVHFLPTPTPNTWHINLQVADNLLLVANERIIPGWGPVPPTDPYLAGIQLFDVSDPTAPRRLGGWSTTGSGTHRNWFPGGRYAYLSASEDGYAGRFLIILDVSDPEHPHEAGRWWLPGQAVKFGETPAWAGREHGHWGLHGPIVAGDFCYLAYEDNGVAIVNVADPAQPELVGHFNVHPPFGGYAHTALPLPNRHLLVVAEETIAYNCREEQKRIWLVDIREPARPVPFATLPMPKEPPGEPPWCEKGGRFGPHNLHENRPGAFQSEILVFNAFFNAGLRVWDIRNPFEPREVAWFIPPAPEKMYDIRTDAPRAVSSQDVYVDDRGYCFLTDYNAGLYVIELEGEARELMRPS